ncbi:MAG: oxidoreductase [Anaerocolumna sp.]|nr:oxidoreductase [Anaerocolumna sp.]
MIYKEFQEIKLSALGMGVMRLPVMDGVYANIDEIETDKMVAYAMDQGINYYDTAWGYHDGQSEIAIGKALSKYPRKSYYLATKFPGYDPSNWANVEIIFEEQLKKCGGRIF